MDYQAFLTNKRITAPSAGFEAGELSPSLFPWQARIVQWACRKGRAAIFADCGLGKTLQQLAWADQVARHTGRPVLILAPLAVAEQTRREGAKFGYEVTVCQDRSDVRPGINVANYERLHRMDPGQFGGVVLDESSILKGDGPMRRGVCEAFAETPYRLACTATPAPNDTAELINHAEFLGIMSGNEILALFFIQDGNTTHKWRLKGHARTAFWRWLASWAVALRSPADLGDDSAGFDLPPLNLHQHAVSVPVVSGTLFAVEARGIEEQRHYRRATLADRVSAAAALVAAAPDEQWLIWCDLNDESEALAKAIPEAVEVAGKHSDEQKAAAMLGFAEGRVKVLVSKPSICGFGMNFQSCARTIFVGLGNSYEAYYQALRRNWRFGQTRPVEAHVIVSEADGEVVRNIQRKEAEHREMMAQLVEEMGSLNFDQTDRQEMNYQTGEQSGKGWRLLLGDCVERVREIETESVGLSVFSPPFPSMYAYTNSARDMGNAASFEEMLEHFGHLMPELLRVTQPGRSCCIHLTQALAFLSRDGYIGMKDFRGRTIEAMERAGWVYYGEVTIDKNPQLKAIRTKDRGLLFKTLATDSSHMHMALADYLLQFRKPGENANPIKAGASQKYGNPHGWISAEEWIRWARPVWYAADFAPDGDGISETDVLPVQRAREADDEKHLCPLQLGVIERAVKLWSAPGDLVFSPFAGVGSEGYESIRLGRRFVGTELKRAYFDAATRNLRQAETLAGQTRLDLFADLSELSMNGHRELAGVA